MNTNSLILYEGPSQLDPSIPIICVATGLNYSSNSKTGGMIQTYIIRSDMNPIEAVKTKQDKAICGDCKYSGNGGCYVNIAQAPNQIYKTYKKGKYRKVTKDDWVRFKGKNIRVASYGDPSCTPYIIWYNILKLTNRHTAYTHAWRDLGPQWQFCMASTDSEQERLEAQSLGWRTFTVITELESMDSKEIICPATTPESNVQCNSCMLCAGNKSKGKNINVVAHGLKWKVDRVKQQQLKYLMAT